MPQIPRMPHLHVLIVGAGLGGLCLAQALRQHDIDVTIFERDASLWDRPQGYRLHIDTDGVEALAQALPADLYRLFAATSMAPQPFTTIVDTSLAVQQRLPSDEYGSTQAQAAHGRPFHVNVNRATLRQILATDLADCLAFGKKLVRYETGRHGVTVTFADGSTAHGDVLVGADGIHSGVRRQRVPHAQIEDTGLRAIYGRIPLAQALAVTPEQARADVFTSAIDSQRRLLGLGPVIFPTRPEVAAAQIAPHADLRPQGDYVACLVVGRTELFGADDARLQALSSEALQQVAVGFLTGWPEGARAIPAQGDPASFFFVEMATSVPFHLPPASQVTLLGDAIHAMTPTLGRGANTALRDAALLGQKLISVRQGQDALANALRLYEAEMTRYGFEVVRNSAALGTRLVGQTPLPTPSVP